MKTKLLKKIRDNFKYVYDDNNIILLSNDGKIKQKITSWLFFINFHLIKYINNPIKKIIIINFCEKHHKKLIIRENIKAYKSLIKNGCNKETNK